MEPRLVGTGLYTPVEAGRLLRVAPGKLSRWLRGHTMKGTRYERLWEPQVDIGDGHVYLGFRDLMEARVVDAFIRQGISAIRIRRAIQVAAEMITESHPLATNRFRTDGREIFLQVIETDEHGQERERLLNLFQKQYEFRGIIEPILKTVDFGDEGDPLQWWPQGRRAGIVVDPARAFGAPIEAKTSVPTSILAEAAHALGITEAAVSYDVSEAAVRRALDFEHVLEPRIAA
ncbi:hypothetical protein [Rhodovulum sulfidophilum]|uniref:hypothetical protein n=1 Tax=Rhodovulum sulfidophilum TaxID=35806 RepID=UPI00095291A6|nr:hypothetical protein [Rhodovulum sulfidophilum]OLS53759.1 hypothetical protein BV392_18415 [Rhodovulum sulfidophilum]